MYSRHYMRRGNLFGAGILAFAAGAIVWAFFGDKIKSRISRSEKYRDLRRQIYDRASEVSDLTQEKYDLIVDELSNKYAQVKGISQNELRDLVDDLKWHYRRIKSSWKNNRY